MRKPNTRGNVTKEKILQAGIKAWLKDPSKVTFSSLALILKVQHSLIRYHFEKNLKDSVADYAIKTNHEKMIRLLIASGHKSVKNLSGDARKAYIQRMMGEL